MYRSAAFKCYNGDKPICVNLTEWLHIHWDYLPGGNVEHIEEHDLTAKDVDYVLENYESKDASHSSGYSVRVWLHSRWSIYYRCL